MAVDKGLVAHVLELLEPLGGLSGRAMFGGYGIWHEGTMFALFDSQSVLYFKVADTNRAAYEAAGSAAFAPPRPGGGAAMSMSYFSVPAAVLEEGEALREWARASIAVARAAPASKARARKQAGPPSP